MDSPNTWMAIAVSDPDAQRFELRTNTLYPNITVFHKERARFYDKQPYILEEKGLIELLNVGMRCYKLLPS